MTHEHDQFEDAPRILAFPASLLADLPDLSKHVSQGGYARLAADIAYGVGAAYPTILCGWDDTGHTVKRGVWFPQTAGIDPEHPPLLTDGRSWACGLWSLDVVAAWKAALAETPGYDTRLADIEELTLAQLKSLIPSEESV